MADNSTYSDSDVGPVDFTNTATTTNSAPNTNDYTTGLQNNYAYNKAYAKPGNYFTSLPPDQEAAFRQWVTDNKVNFDPNAKITDYDMRGFWKAEKGNTQINKYDHKIHYPDTYKTPYDRTFSNQSQYALPNAPSWKGDRYLIDSNGKVVFDQSKDSEDSPYPKAILNYKMNVPQETMDEWNAQATAMANIGGPGANVDAAQQWLQNQYAQSAALPNTSQAVYSEADVAPVSSLVKVDKFQPDSTLTNIGQALKSVPATDWQATKDYYSQAGSDMADTMQGVHDYFANFHANHQVQPARPVTPQEISAMKAHGINPDQAMTDGNLIRDFNSPTGYSFAPTYKTTPGEDLSSVGDADKHPTVPGYLLNQSFPSKLIQGIASPHLATTKFQQAVQDTIQQQKIIANPSKYSPAQVAQAKQTLDEYKQQAAMTTMQKVKEGIHAIVQNPGDLITSLLGDPTMWLAGEAKLGTLAYGKDIEKASQAAKTAQDIADSARKIKEYALANNVADKAKVLEKANKYIKVYGGVADKAAANVKRLSRLAKPGDVVGAAASGAVINSVLSQQQQLSEQGFTNPKDTQAAGITGAAFGGVLGTLGALGHEGEIPKTHPDGGVETKGPVAVREPGQPLPSTTPVDATKVVPYYGGVDAQGNVIHISKDTPIHIEMKDKTGNPVQVPVRQTVAYHESVEHPLMHLTGPVSDAQMQLIKERMGPYAHMPAEVEAKLREGKALSYGEAHDIATRSENHLVESMYGVDHNTYQDALKPHIAKVAKESASAKAEDIPANLDTKPYDNMGHPEQLHGQGDRPAQDAGQPGGGESKNIIEDKDVSPVTKEQPTPSGEVSPQLPQQLRGAKPWYSFGSKRFKLQFANDLDKAAYISAGSKPSKADAAYVKFVSDHLGLTEAEVRARGREIKARIKEEAKNKQLPDGKVGVINVRHLAAAALTLGAAGYGAYQAGPGHRTEGTFKGLFGGMTMFGHQAMFAGARSTGWNPKSEIIAKAMEGIGKTPEQIHLATGLTKDKAGHWSREFSDRDMEVTNLPAKGTVDKLSNVLNHPKFAREYPDLFNDLKITIIDRKGTYGGYDRKSNTIYLNPAEIAKDGGSLSSTLAHELQHAVQNWEGFPSGSNAAQEGKALNKVLDYLYNRNESLYQKMIELERSGKEDKIPSLERQYAKTSKLIGEIESNGNKAFNNYKKQAGEVQARNTQNRLNLTEEERGKLSPQDTQDTSIKDQLVRYGKPQEHELSIADHLQKTGEMDDEGKLSGMVLPEDKLPNEHEVLAKAAQNDQGAISKLYKQYMPRLTRNARGLMRTAGPRLGMDAEDLAMYVFHKAIMHLKAGTFKGDSSFYTWMHTILHNTGLNEISRAGRTVPTESIHGATHDAFGSPVSDIKPAVRNIDSGESTPEENMIARQTSNMVQHAISKLPQDIRETIKAYEFDGKSYEEIAREQGVPVGTVRSRLNRGRDMIEQSIKRGHGANFRKQQGFATFDQMKRAALLGAGAFAGYTLGGQDHHWKDAFFGALAGIGAGAITLKGIARVARDVRNADTLPRASSTLDKLEGSLGKLQRHTDTIQAQMAALQGMDSLNIAHSIEGDTSIKLTPEQQKVKETAQALYTHIRSMAKAAGMSMQEVENYTTHLFKPTEKNRAIIDAFNKQQSTPLSKNSPFTKTRKLRMSLADAIAKGMELKHDNFADTFAEYYKSMLGAIHTKVAIDTLRVATDLEKRPLVTKTSMAPYGYQVINHPALRGLSVHPAIAAEMSHMFDVHTPTHLGFAYQFVNSALKRIAFMGSLFHGQTLADVQMGMSLNPYKNIKTTLQALAGKTEFQKAVKNPQPGDMVDKILETGQKVPSNSTGFTEDLGKSMGPGFKFLEDEMNKLFPGLGNLPRAAAAVDHAYQWIIFNRLGGGLMGQATHIMFGKLKANWLKEITKDPSKVMPSDDDLMRRAASMSSVSFGSLNWRRMANEVQNKYMRSFLMSTLSPAGRRTIQSIMLAPEWLTSTTMHWTKALFGKGEGSPIHPLNAVDLHRSWLLKSLVYSTLFGNALNYMFSGHSMMENKDKFMIDLGDGQKTPWMKELSDFPRLFMDPAQEILNKLAPIPRLADQQFTGKKYLSAKGYSPSLRTTGDRVQNIVDALSPFSMSQNDTGGWKADIASMLGHPIYGMTPTSKRDAMMKQRQKAIKEKMAKMSGGQ